MSLDVTLYTKQSYEKKFTGIYIKENGVRRLLTAEESAEKYPELEFEIVEEDTINVYWFNITHNLNKMAAEAELYSAMWRPYMLLPNAPVSFDSHEEESKFERDNGEIKAEFIIPYLEKGVEKLKSDPDYYKQFNPENGWGTYEGLVNVAEKYLEACKDYPHAYISTDR